MDKVLFVDFAYSIGFFSKVYKKLISDMAIEPVIATYHGRKYNKFRGEGVSAILLSTPKELSNEELKLGREILKNIESKFEDFDSELAIARDRFLKLKSNLASKNILYAAAYEMDRILKRNRYSLVIGEISTAIEYVFCFVAALRGVPYRHLLNLPTSDSRITLFDFAHSSDGTRYIGGSPIERVKDSSVINYSVLCDRVRNSRFRVFDYFSNLVWVYSPRDYRTSLLYKIRYLIKPFYSVFYQVLEALYSVKKIDSGGAYFFPLHVQPEATPDYVSIHYADQLKLASRIADGLSPQECLYIKEHPNVLSFRNPLKLLKLLQKKNIRMLPRDIDASKFMGEMELTLTVAGTAALHSIRSGKPAVVFSGCYLKDLPLVVDGRSFDEIELAIQEAKKIKRNQVEEERVEQMLCSLGLPGYVHDERIVPEVLDDSNIYNICYLIKSFVEKMDVEYDQKLMAI